MSRIWTERGAGAGRPRGAWLAAACCGALLGLSCGGKTQTPDLIKPIMASATIEPVSAPLPYIYVTNPQSFGDLVTVDVVLHTTTSLSFDAYNLEFSYDPRLVQPELHDEGGAITPFPTATASSGAVCNDTGAVCAGAQTTNPFCASSSVGETPFVFGASVNTGDGCLGTTVGQDTLLLTIGLQAETTGTSLIEIGPPGSTSCAILNNLTSVGVGCYGKITLTATR